MCNCYVVINTHAIYWRRIGSNVKRSFTILKFLLSTENNTNRAKTDITHLNRQLLNSYRSMANIETNRIHWQQLLSHAINMLSTEDSNIIHLFTIGHYRPYLLSTVDINIAMGNYRLQKDSETQCIILVIQLHSRYSVWQACKRKLLYKCLSNPYYNYCFIYSAKQCKNSYHLSSQDNWR